MSTRGSGYLPPIPAFSMHHKTLQRGRIQKVKKSKRAEADANCHSGSFNIPLMCKADWIFTVLIHVLRNTV